MINYLLLEHYLITLVLGVGSASSLVNKAMNEIRNVFVGIPYKVVLDVHENPEEDLITLFLIIKNDLSYEERKEKENQLNEWLFSLNSNTLMCFGITTYFI